MRNFLHFILCFFVCFCLAFQSAASQSSANQGEILSYEIIEEETQPAQQMYSVHDKNKSVLQEKEHEYLIDEMDVYALSPAAKLLAMPHMVSMQYNYENDKNIDWEQVIAGASQTYGVEKALIWAVIKVESNFIAHAVSQKGAVGAMQIIPETQKELGLVCPTDAKDNVFAGTKYLKQQLELFDGDIALALAAYNAGAGNVQKYKGIPPYKETQAFVKKVMAYREAY